ncbi:uncharacterized protein [Aristolochia californica]|uniref:uncharacterized protein n=1 Tax=Aristolochia californica TaxID=171875 RepID=UPI0035E1709E
MARLMPLPHDLISPARAGRIGAMSFLLCVVAFIMCASRRKKWPRSRHSSDPVMQLDLDSRFLTTTRVQPGGFEEGFMGGEAGAICVWQKKILMGEKCQLPDFSGIISYDSDGNIIPAHSIK